MSILVVIAVMLALQGGLNKLKFRALVAEATASQLQVFAATIENTIIRSERLGLAMRESAGATELLDRLRHQNTDIAQILVVTPRGETALSSGTPTLDVAYKDELLRRVFAGNDMVTIFDAGPLLYTARTMLNSANEVMGAVVITVPTEKFLGPADQSFASLVQKYQILFIIIAVGLCPFIVFQFAGIGRAYRMLDPENLHDEHTPLSDADPDIQRLQSLLHDGNHAYAAAKTELTLLGVDDQTGAKV